MNNRLKGETIFKNNYNYLPQALFIFGKPQKY